MTVYVIHAPEVRRAKIGYTKDTTQLLLRVAQLQAECPVELQLIGFLSAGTRADEKRLHQQFADVHVRGEWFRDVVIESLRPILEPGC